MTDVFRDLGPDTAKAILDKLRDHDKRILIVTTAERAIDWKAYAVHTMLAGDNQHLNSLPSNWSLVVIDFEQTFETRAWVLDCLLPKLVLNAEVMDRDYCFGTYDTTGRRLAGTGGYLNMQGPNVLAERDVALALVDQLRKTVLQLEQRLCSIWRFGLVGLGATVLTSVAWEPLGRAEVALAQAAWLPAAENWKGLATILACLLICYRGRRS